MMNIKKVTKLIAIAMLAYLLYQFTWNNGTLIQICIAGTLFLGAFVDFVSNLDKE